MSVFAECTTPVTAYPLGNELLDYPDVTVTVEQVVPTGESIHYVWLAGNGRDELLANLRADDRLGLLAGVDEIDDRTLVRLEWSDVTAPVFESVAETNGSLVGLQGTHQGWRFDLRFPDEDALSVFYEVCQKRSVPIEFAAIYESDRFSDDGFGMTERQAETLLEAYEERYYDVPRGVTLADLAAQLDVSEQAVSERLRRAIAMLLDTTVFEDRTVEADD